MIQTCGSDTTRFIPPVEEYSPASSDFKYFDFKLIFVLGKSGSLLIQRFYKTIERWRENSTDGVLGLSPTLCRFQKSFVVELKPETS